MVGEGFNAGWSVCSCQPDPEGLTQLEAFLRLARDLGDNCSMEFDPILRRSGTDPSLDLLPRKQAPLERRGTDQGQSRRHEEPSKKNASFGDKSIPKPQTFQRSSTYSGPSADNELLPKVSQRQRARDKRPSTRVIKPADNDGPTRTRRQTLTPPRNRRQSGKVPTDRKQAPGR